jgi:hypothetical protein
MKMPVMPVCVCRPSPDCLSHDWAVCCVDLYVPHDSCFEHCQCMSLPAQTNQDKQHQHRWADMRWNAAFVIITGAWGLQGTCRLFVVCYETAFQTSIVNSIPL